MQDGQVKKLVNRIFGIKGLPKVTNFAAEFSDGGKSKSKFCHILCFSNFLFGLELFQKLFNILYEEAIDCRLVKSKLEEDKILNWNRINV